VSEATQLAERALYRLSLDPQARALAERLLERFRGMVGSLPASALGIRWSVCAFSGGWSEGTGGV